MDLLFLLFCKHALCDLWLQSYHVHSHKHLYWGGHRHYAEHGVGTLLVCVLFVDPASALAAALFDYVCHWHIDHSKTVWVRARGYSRSSPVFWRVQSLDQMLHYATYFVIAQFLVG